MLEISINLSTLYLIFRGEMMTIRSMDCMIDLLPVALGTMYAPQVRNLQMLHLHSKLIWVAENCYNGLTAPSRLAAKLEK